ncbi:DUF4244 domain-containing protein [Sinomonas albida]|uniref:DUF4244 domain-containing protein n=1 Tax=Sinomonas albida TaxID=369942 RepID=UPI003015CCB3
MSSGEAAVSVSNSRPESRGAEVVELYPGALAANRALEHPGSGAEEPYEVVSPARAAEHSGTWSERSLRGGGSTWAQRPKTAVRRPPAARLEDGRSEAGMATAEYAIATLGAVAFAGLLVVILRSDEVRGFLLGIIRSALSIP